MTFLETYMAIKLPLFNCFVNILNAFFFSTMTCFVVVNAIEGQEVFSKKLIKWSIILFIILSLLNIIMPSAQEMKLIMNAERSYAAQALRI